MYSELQKRQNKRTKRALRVRKTCRGSGERPRLSVHKTNMNLFAQIIDDEAGNTLVGLGTLSKEFKGTGYSKKSKESAREIGKRIAEKALEKNISAVVFDRGRFKFHGLIAELANAAREAGLQF